MRQIDLHISIAAPVQRVWDQLTDHVSWQDWAGVKEVVLRQEGDPAPNGLGAIRVVRDRGLAVEEEVIAFEPPKRMVYRMVAGAPVRDYVGEVTLDPVDGGEGGAASTRVHWKVTYRPLIPGTGWLLDRGLRAALEGVLERLDARLRT